MKALHNMAFLPQPVNVNKSPEGQDQTGLDTTTWLTEHGLGHLIALFEQNGLTVEVLMFANESELTQLCEESWHLDTISKIKFLSAMRKQNGSALSKMQQTTLVRPAEQHILDSLQQQKALIQRSIDDFERANAQLTRDSTDCTRHVHSACDSMVDKIEAYRTQLLRDISLSSEQRSGQMGSALDSLFERLTSISTAHRECRAIVREESADADSKLRRMKSIASAQCIGALSLELQCSDARMSVEYDLNAFRDTLQRSLSVQTSPLHSLEPIQSVQSVPSAQSVLSVDAAEFKVMEERVEYEILRFSQT